jgi:hypothetical protein
MDDAWRISKTVLRWEGGNAIDENREGGYMMTEFRETYGGVAGFWLEPVGDNVKVTALIKGGLLYEDWLHLRFAQAVNRELHVRRSIAGDRKVKLTKTESPRTVDLSARLVSALSRRQEEREKEALLAGEDPSPWLFPSRLDRPLSPNVLGRLFREVRQAAGIPHFTLYDLRHTYATHLLTEGADLLYVAHQLGHAKPTTTLLYYAHFMPRGDKKHLDRMMARRESGFSPAPLPHSVQRGRQLLEKLAPRAGLEPATS